MRWAIGVARVALAHGGRAPDGVGGRVIKYLGSKRRLVPVLGRIAGALGVQTALDLFTGTTRVARELKQRGAEVWAIDSARYAEVLAQCYIATDLATVDKDDLRSALDHLDSLPGRPGYVTRTFCEEARYFQPKNGARIDAIRDAIEADFADSPLRPLLLTSLMLAADKVDSTTGVQMAYLKQWAPRSHKDLRLVLPELIAGRGHAHLGDATELVDRLPRVDLAYLDPPYNQHRYVTNYHVWETLIAWDAPEAYGVARKRIDSRDDATKSVFNKKAEMPAALRSTIGRVQADFLVVSYNDEAWVTMDDLVDMCAPGREAVEVLAFDSKRYVGAQIGIHNPAGERVGRVSHLRNVEWLVLAGDRDRVAAAMSAAGRT